MNSTRSPSYSDRTRGQHPRYPRRIPAAQGVNADGTTGPTPHARRGRAARRHAAGGDPRRQQQLRGDHRQTPDIPVPTARTCVLAGCAVASQSPPTRGQHGNAYLRSSLASRHRRPTATFLSYADLPREQPSPVAVARRSCYHLTSATRPRYTTSPLSHPPHKPTPPPTHPHPTPPQPHTHPPPPPPTQTLMANGPRHLAGKSCPRTARTTVRKAIHKTKAVSSVMTAIA